jgi:hypothetical protein
MTTPVASSIVVVTAARKPRSTKISWNGVLSV